MRPTALESLRGLQAALVEAISPELSSMYAQDVTQTMQMLLESLAGETDRAAEDLRSDNQTVAALLSDAKSAIEVLPERNEQLSLLVPEIESVLAEPADGSLTISALTARNDRLCSTLERLLVALEDMAQAPETHTLMLARAAIYTHLRQVAVRGWSFWDVSSFRERMARARAEASKVTG